MSKKKELINKMLDVIFKYGRHKPKNKGKKKKGS